MRGEPLTRPGDVIHIDEGRAVECIESELADWPRMGDDGEDGGTVRFVLVRTRPTRLEPLRKGDPRIGVNERIRMAIAGARTAQERVA